MKKVATIFTIVCLTVFFTNVSAQDIKFGVKGSFLTSTISVKDAGVDNLRQGFAVGLYGQYNLNDQLGVSFEPVYALKGANKIDPYMIYAEGSPLFWDEFNGESYNFLKHDLSLSVFELPVLAQLNLDMGMGLHVFGGPSFDFILKAKHLYKREDVNHADDFYNDYVTEADVTDRFAYYDFGLVAGAGIEIEADPIDIRVDLRYRYGLSEINKVQYKPNINQHCISLSVGIGINKFFF